MQNHSNNYELSENAIKMMFFLISGQQMMYLSLMSPNVPAIVVAAVDASELLLGEIGVTLLCMVRPDVVVVLEDHPAVALPISLSNTLFVLHLVMISGVRVEFMVES